MLQKYYIHYICTVYGLRLFVPILPNVAYTDNMYYFCYETQIICINETGSYQIRGCQQIQRYIRT